MAAGSADGGGNGTADPHAEALDALIKAEGFPEKAIGGNKWVTQYGPAKFYDAKDNYFRSEPGSRPPPRL